MLSFPAFCTSPGCSAYLELDVESLRQAHDIAGKKCPVCGEGVLTYLYPPGYSDELTHKVHHVHGVLGFDVYEYHFDGVLHFIFVVDEEVVFFAGYKLGRWGCGWLYCQPASSRQVGGHVVAWEGYDLTVDSVVVFSPSKTVARLFSPA